MRADELPASRPLLHFDEVAAIGRPDRRPDPPLVDPRVLMDRSLTLVGGDLWSWLSSPAEHRARAARLLDAVAQGQLQVRIAASVPLAEGRRAHELLESRSTIGKIILIF